MKHLSKSEREEVKDLITKWHGKSLHISPLTGEVIEAVIPMLFLSILTTLSWGVAYLTWSDLNKLECHPIDHLFCIVAYSGLGALKIISAIASVFLTMLEACIIVIFMIRASRVL